MEDVFLKRVILGSRNYRVLEGHYEANGQHLQHILHAVEEFPDSGKLGAAKRSCEALLVLSDLLCARSGLNAYEVGPELPSKEFPIRSIPTMKRLAARTTFSYGELATLGCDVQLLDRFVLPADERRSISWSPNERNVLDRQPLLDTGAEIITALPSALGAAIRESIIQACIETGTEFQIRAAVLRSRTDAFRKNLIFRKAGIPGGTIYLDNPLVSSPPVEIEPGYWVHCALLVDDLEGFLDGGLLGISSRGGAASTALQTEIEKVSAYCHAQPGFKSGLTLVVICGFGRTMAVDLSVTKDWLAAGANDYDVEVMGCLDDFDLSELIKFCCMERDLKSKGFKLVSLVRRGKARFPSGCESHSAVVVSAGSSQSGLRR